VVSVHRDNTATGFFASPTKAQKFAEFHRAKTQRLRLLDKAQSLYRGLVVNAITHWKHINLTGDYVWRQNKRVEHCKFRPLRHSRWLSVRFFSVFVSGPLWVSAIEHVGSTSVPGLAAKPIIDLDVLLASAAYLPETIRRLATFGHEHQGDLGIAGREAFRAPPTLLRIIYTSVSQTVKSSERLIFLTVNVIQTKSGRKQQLFALAFYNMIQPNFGMVRQRKR